MSSIRSVTVILNSSSGMSREGAPADAVRASLVAAGITEIEIIPLSKGLDLERVVADRLDRGTQAIVAAGGDGTMNAVASVLAGTPTPMGALPTGTLNHFAGDLAIPSDLDAAAQVIAGGHTTQVDTGEVNGRIFLNNSSIGLYPEMVRVREALMERGIPKRVATWAGVFGSLWKFPNTTVRLMNNRSGLVAKTPLVFIGNNAYQISGSEAGGRKSLQEGLLQVCTVTNPTRLGLFRTLIDLTGDF